MTDLHRPLIWADVVGLDFPATREFYRTVFGWRPELLAETDEFTYWIFWAGQHPVVGGEPIPEHKAPSRWTVWVQTDDIEETAARVVSAGGKVTYPATRMADLGRFSMVADSHGATLGLWEADSIDPSTVGDVPGRVVGGRLVSEDPARDFYLDALAWTADEIDGRIASGQEIVSLVAEQSRGDWLPVLQGTSETCQLVLAAGGTWEPLPGGDEALVTDPFGAQLVVRVAQP